MTVAELLKSKGIADEVAAGLPKEIVTHLEGYLTEADTKFQTAQSEAAKAEEARRVAELERKEVAQYVENYGKSLTEITSLKAKNKAMAAYLETIKKDGFEVPAELVGDVTPGVKPVVPGSPAEGANAFDPNKFMGQVGDVMSQWMDANNEHLRLFGTPVPDSSTVIAEEAARARKPIGQYISEKYGFRARQTAREQELFQKKVDDAVKSKLEEERRKAAEESGGNPNLRPGVSSRNSHIPKIKHDEFQKASGNIPTRDRHQKMLEKIHAELVQSA